MIAGSVSELGVPVIEVEIGGQRWRAIIGTGFNGQVELPKPLRPNVNARFVGQVSSLLAANQRIVEEVFLVDFPFDGHTVQVEATFSDDSEILIGTGMLRDYRLAVDFPAGTVAIEKS